MTNDLSQPTYWGTKPKSSTGMDRDLTIPIHLYLGKYLYPKGVKKFSPDNKARCANLEEVSYTQERNDADYPEPVRLQPRSSYKRNNESWIAQIVEWKIFNKGSPRFKSSLSQGNVTTENVQRIGCTFMIDDQRNNSDDTK